MKELRDARIADARQLEQKGQVDPWVVNDEHNGTDTLKGCAQQGQDFGH